MPSSISPERLAVEATTSTRSPTPDNCLPSWSSGWSWASDFTQALGRLPSLTTSPPVSLRRIPQ
jgi:hypothetical protein